MTIMTGNSDFIHELLKAIGAPKHVKSFDLHASIDKPVTVRIEYYPEKPAHAVIYGETEIKTFELHEKTL